MRITFYSLLRNPNLIPKLQVFESFLGGPEPEDPSLQPQHCACCSGLGFFPGLDFSSKCPDKGNGTYFPGLLVSVSDLEFRI